MNNKKKNEGQTDFSYYGLYLLDYLSIHLEPYDGFPRCIR